MSGPQTLAAPILRRIELLGFKSFPERTVIEFAAGVSGIVGPNGCGKSNIVDAVRWVLGEQNPRALRAERMEDLIFGGTEGRAALGVAEVTLVLTNEVGFLSLEVAEVEIRRRLHRSGESEYFINREPTRLRDVRELFLDTGVGKSAYSIMEQGQIDQLLASRPEDRRAVFEEAAGIARFRARGADAERKLAQTQENIQQVETVLAEISRTREGLEEQVGRTRAYRSLQEQVFGAERDLELVRLRELKGRREEAKGKLRSAEADREAIRSQIRAAADHVQSGEQSLKRMERELAEAQRHLYGTQLKRANVDDQVRTARERIAETERSMQSFRDRDAAVAAKITAAEGDLAERQADENLIDERLATVDAQVAENAAATERCLAEVRENDDAIAAAVEAAKQDDERLSSMRESLRAIIDDIVSSLDSGLQSVGYSPEARAAAERDIAAVLAELRGTLTSDGATAELRQRIERAVGMVDTLQGLISSYEGMASSFIDDFLSPEGIVTKKRELDDELGSTIVRIAEARRSAEERRAASGRLGQEIHRLRDAVEALQVQKATEQTRRTNVHAEIGRLDADITELRGTRGDLAREEEAAAAAIEAQAAGVAKLEAQRGELDGAESALRQQAADVQSQLAGHGDAQDSRVAAVATLEEDLEKATAEVEEMRGSERELAAEIRATVQRFQETHAQDLSQYELDLTQAETREELTQLVEQLRGQMAELGQVNLMAPEQFREVDERYQFLDGQLVDLRTASADLENVTREIQVDSATLFREAFKEIRDSFQVVFRRLFGGGRTELRLTDPENVLSSGVEFYAQPPGKKLENIAQLSGGERALTAVSLLFAIYSVRPSPFCVLDEIDAALDEENVGRLAELLTEFASDSQFLVVTHSKRTAAGTGNLYGFTMEEPGVSRVVTLRLPGAELDADAARMPRGIVAAGAG